MATRWIAVDDADTSITYIGPWFVRTSSFSENRNGFAFHGAQHGTNGTASVAFTFLGSRVRVQGTSAVTNSSGVLDPSWDCLVDGSPTRIGEASNNPMNRWQLCTSPNLVEGEHTLSINAKAQSRTFWVDQIQYLPPASAKSLIAHPTVIIQPSDPTIQYLAGHWEKSTSGADSMLTTEVGAKLSVKFSGTKLTWVGWTPPDFPTGSSSATYSIDNQTPKTFTISGLPVGSNGLYHQTWFETDALSNGNHSLTVVHQGASTPLTFDYLLIEDGDIIRQTVVTDPVAPANDTTSGDTDSTGSIGKGGDVPIEPQPQPKSKGKTPTGAIVGGVIGGVALLGICFLLFYFFRKRRERRGRRRAESSALPASPNFGTTQFLNASPQNTGIGGGSSAFPTPAQSTGTSSVTAQMNTAPLLPQSLYQSMMASGLPTNANQLVYSSSSSPVYPVIQEESPARTAGTNPWYSADGSDYASGSSSPRHPSGSPIPAVYR